MTETVVVLSLNLDITVTNESLRTDDIFSALEAYLARYSMQA